MAAKKGRRPPMLDPMDVSGPGGPSPYVVTSSGTFKEGELSINRNGIFIGKTGGGPQRSTDRPAGPIENLSMQDLKVIDVLGQGSSGLVQRVLHVPTGRMLALKVVPLNVSDEKVRKQMILELKTLHDSKSKYIVSFMGAFYHDGAISMALEYMDGGSLLDILKAVGPLPESILGKIAGSVLKGLSYLHKERHLIHRDIKPANLLVNLEGEVKISDFGVSGEMASSLSSEKAASWVGTVCYMSPDRIRGLKYGYETDIWSFGLSLVECAFGIFPYPPPGERQRNLSFWELMDYIVEKPPPDMPPDHFSPEFCSFIESTLRKVPEDRPTANELLVHPFIMKYAFEDIDMGAWARDGINRFRSGAAVTRSIDMSNRPGLF